MAALDLCRQVTSNGLGKCPLDAAETLSPYAMAGGSEEPIAAGVVLHDQLKKNAAMGITNSDYLRPGATKVVFGVAMSRDQMTLAATSKRPKTRHRCRIRNGLQCADAGQHCWLLQTQQRPDVRICAGRLDAQLRRR